HGRLTRDGSTVYRPWPRSPHFAPHPTADADGALRFIHLIAGPPRALLAAFELAQVDAIELLDQVLELVREPFGGIAEGGDVDRRDDRAGRLTADFRDRAVRLAREGHVHSDPDVEV